MSGIVFFGPFIGEFAWEIRSWQGWVRKVCTDSFNGYRKIASSFEGRAGLYPDMDEFWPVPKSFQIHNSNAVKYLIKGWRHGVPGNREYRFVPKKEFRDGQVYLDYQKEEVYEAAHGLDIEPIANAMLDDFKKRLPKDTIYFTPWKYNRIEEGDLEFGLLPPDHPLVNIAHPLPKHLRLIVREIPPQYQVHTKIQAPPASRKILNGLIEPETKLIAIFPRNRKQYATRNWPKMKYEKLIVLLQNEFPQSKIAIVGEPGGSYFDDGVPPDTLDLINLDPINRVSIQIAAMEKSLFALGSSSGGLLLPYFTNCPVFKWSNPDDEEYDLSDHIPSTPAFNYPIMQPEVDEVLKKLLEFWQLITKSH